MDIIFVSKGEYQKHFFCQGVGTDILSNSEYWHILIFIYIYIYICVCVCVCVCV